MTPEEEIAPEVEKMMMDLSLLDFMKEKGYQPPPARPPGFGITVVEYAASTIPPMTEQVARNALEAAVKAKQLAKQRMSFAGTRAMIYYRETKK